jgi:hypothetical protein
MFFVSLSSHLPHLVGEKDTVICGSALSSLAISSSLPVFSFLIAATREHKRSGPITSGIFRTTLSSYWLEPAFCFLSFVVGSLRCCASGCCRAAQPVCRE